jgi:integrase
MADIRKRTGSKGTTYQVRYASPEAKSGYAYATFDTLKEARQFRESGEIIRAGRPAPAETRTVSEATDLWLRACEKEGLNGREPVTRYTLKNYEYRAEIIKAYAWPKELSHLTTPDVVAFRSWLLQGDYSRAVASKVLSTFHSVMKEMTVRGVISHNPAIGVSVRADSRYAAPVSIPSKREIAELLAAADRLAASSNKLTAKTWRRYRPMLYLAVDSGMRPQEYIAAARSALRDDGILVDRAVEGGGTEITVTKTPSGRRFVELSPATVSILREYIENHSVKNDHDLIFTTDNGGWLCRRNWQRRGFDAACEEAGLVVPAVVDGKPLVVDGEAVLQPKYRPYDLRHFYASMLIERKINLKKIQALMGHANIETTLNVYGHLLEDEKSERISAIGLLSEISGISCGKSVARAG